MPRNPAFVAFFFTESRREINLSLFLNFNLSQNYLKILENANRDLLMCFEKLQKARANGNPEGIKQASMEYLKALQILYTNAQSAVSEPIRFKSS